MCICERDMFELFGILAFAMRRCIPTDVLPPNRTCIYHLLNVFDLNLCVGYMCRALAILGFMIHE